MKSLSRCLNSTKKFNLKIYKGTVMEIRVKVKPKVVKAKSRESLLHLIVGGHNFCWQSNAVAYKPMYGEGKSTTVRVFNLHKVNPKYRQIKYKTSNPKTGAVKGRTRKTELVREGEWIAYVYDLDLNMLRLANLEVRQGTRNFTLKQVKK